MSRKGTFAKGLPVAKRYLRPSSRWLLVASGVLLALCVVGIVGYGLFVEPGRFLSSGPLSSAHASFDADCRSCHEPLAAPSPEKCSVCHEKLGDELGVYTFASHYVYRSGDFGRIGTRSGEGPCQSCHVEHRGRNADLVRERTEAECLECHDFDSFQDGHPEFEPLRRQSTERSNLTFAHTHHVAELMERNGWIDHEQACLYCHRPVPDGTRFAALEFDSLCDECHLGTEVGTTRLPFGNPSDPVSTGVLTLEAIQQSGRAGTDWSFYMNPGELQRTGRRITKRPLHHRDPWVLENLRQLRQLLYPDAGLGDLLQTSADVAEGDQLRLYREALATLRQYALELRSRPEAQVQAELGRIEELLRQTEERLRDPTTVLDETRFLLDGPINADLDEEQVADLLDLAQNLTQPCLQCHRLVGTRLGRVQADQRALLRSHFDHRAHILQRRCVDCHNKIPIVENLADPTALGSAEDAAEILNLPSSESCTECHNADAVSNRCVTCHDFHPDKTNRSDLLLYLRDDHRNARQTLQ